MQQLSRFQGSLPLPTPFLPAMPRTAFLITLYGNERAVSALPFALPLALPFVAVGRCAKFCSTVNRSFG